jgi:hypothetical protein
MEGEQFLKQMAQYIHERMGTEVQVANRMDGTGGRYVWLEKHDSLAAWEEEDKSFQADAEAGAKWKEGATLFTDFETHFWRIL